MGSCTRRSKVAPGFRPVGARGRVPDEGKLWQLRPATLRLGAKGGSPPWREPPTLAAWVAERDAVVRRAVQAQRPLTTDEARRLAELHSERVEAWLDAGHGSCALRDPRLALLVRDAMFHFHGERSSSSHGASCRTTCTRSCRRFLGMICRTSCGHGKALQASRPVSSPARLEKALSGSTSRTTILCAMTRTLSIKSAMSFRTP